MTCAKCGAVLRVDLPFCRECGARVTIATPPPAIAPDPMRRVVTPTAAAPSSRRDIFLGIGGTAIVASGLTYLVTRGPSSASPPAPTLAPTIPVPTRAPSLPTATAEPPTATAEPPTATAEPPTATRVPPTATRVPPTATRVPPTETAVQMAEATAEPPTATRVPPTATRVPPTATRVPLSTATAVPPTATRVPPTPTPSGPRRLVVDASGSGDYTTIASAYANAKPGEIIVVRPGTYRESLTIRSDVRIVGEGGRSKVIVEGAPGANVFDFLGGSATLTGLTIRIVGTGPADKGWGAIAVTGGTPVIEDCDLTSSAGPAVYILGAGANPTIRNCTMRDSRGSGVLVYDQGQGIIELCLISGNGLAGVAIRTGGNPTVRDCEIRDGKSVGVYVFDQGQGTFTGNTLTGNARGAWDIGSTAGRVTRTGNRPNA